MKRFGKRTRVLLAVVSAAVVAAVGGYAYFTTTGTVSYTHLTLPTILRV